MRTTTANGERQGLGWGARLDAFGQRHPNLMLAFVLLAALGVTLLLLSTGAAVIQYEAF